MQSNNQQSQHNFNAGRILFCIKTAALSITILLIISVKGVCADSTRTITRKNIVYATSGGGGSLRSLNYERIFHQGRTFFYIASAGFSLFNKNFSIPLSINAITTGARHRLQLSAGIIPFIERHIHEENFIRKNNVNHWRSYHKYFAPFENSWRFL